MAPRVIDGLDAGARLLCVKETSGGRGVFREARIGRGDCPGREAAGLRRRRIAPRNRPHAVARSRDFRVADARADIVLSDVSPESHSEAHAAAPSGGEDCPVRAVDRTHSALPMKKRHIIRMTQNNTVSTPQPVRGDPCVRTRAFSRHGRAGGSRRRTCGRALGSEAPVDAHPRQISVSIPFSSPWPDGDGEPRLAPRACIEARRQRLTFKTSPGDDRASSFRGALQR